MTTPSPPSGTEERLRTALAAIADSGSPIVLGIAEQRLRARLGPARRAAVAIGAAAAAVVVAAAGVAVGVAAQSHDSPRPGSSTTPTSPSTSGASQVPVTKVALTADLNTGKPIRTIPLRTSTEAPPSLVTGFGSLWVVSFDRLTRVDVTRATVSGTVAGTFVQVVAGSDAMYAARLNDDGTASMERIDPASLQMTTVARLATTITGFAVNGQTAYYAVLGAPSTVSAIDLRTGRTLRTANLPDGLLLSGIRPLAYGAGSLWLSASQQLLRLDPNTLAVLATTHVAASGPSPEDPHGVLYGNGYLWLFDDNSQGAGALWQVSTQTGLVVAAGSGLVADLAFTPGHTFAASMERVLDWSVAAHRFTAASAPSSAVSSPDVVGVATTPHRLWMVDHQALYAFSSP